MKLVKKYFIFLFIFVLFGTLITNVLTVEAESPIVEEIQGKTVYVAPNVEYGNSLATGTEEDPMNLVRATERATAGDTIILLDGSYNLRQRIRLPETQNGNFASRITVTCYPGHENKAILDFSSMVFDGNNRGVQIDGDYWTFYGIDITGAGDNGMYIGGNNNIIEYCRFYNNRDSGLQLGRSDGSYTQIKDWPSNNLIKNCTSFNNYDDETFGENADGFAAKLTTGEGNVFDGCIAYRNCDDGWDLYAKPDSGVVGATIIKNCLSFENGFTLTPHSQDPFDPTTKQVYTTRDGDGIGFKLGGSILEGSVIIENCVAFSNKLEGFADNSNPGVISMKFCTAYNNSVFVNEDGTMFVEEYTLVAVADYILSKQVGNTVSNLSSSRALRDVTLAHGGSYSASAVGEVNVVEMMKQTGAIIGGEGNGGVIYPELHYGRDALVGTALFLTYFAAKNMTMTALKASYPQYFASKNKIELTPAIDVDKVLLEIKSRYSAENVNDIDGVKIDFAESWVHLRKSNTEPIIRIYTEAKSADEADSLAEKFIAEISEICNL